MVSQTDQRTYHSADAPYALPEDELDRKRLNGWHYAQKAYFGSNFRAPLVSPKSILEIGAGSGIWAAEMAEQFPDARVVGVDISPVRLQNVPSNCSFEMCNVVTDWPFEPESFDVIHARTVLAHIPKAKEVIEKAIKTLKPGGFLMLDDGHHQLFDDNGLGSGVKKFYDLYHAHMAQHGVDPAIGFKMQRIVEESKAFLVMDFLAINTPLNGWSQDEKVDALGMGVTTWMLGAYNSLPAGLAASGVTKEVIQDCLVEMADPTRKLYVPMCWFWARKKL